MNPTNTASTNAEIINSLRNEGECYMQKINKKNGMDIVHFMRRRECTQFPELIAVAVLDSQGLSECEHEHRLRDPRDTSKQFAYCHKCQCAIPFRNIKVLIPDFLQ